MKILGVGFNYRPHVAEAPQLGLPKQAVDTAPLFFHKGDALLKPRTPFFLPDMGSSIEYEAELGYPERPIAFSLRRDGEMVQEADSSEMIHSFDALIAYVSRFQTLRMGDLIFTGTPAGVGPIAIGQTLEGFIGERKVLHVPIK